MKRVPKALGTTPSDHSDHLGLILMLGRALDDVPEAVDD